MNILDAFIVIIIYWEEKVMYDYFFVCRNGSWEEQFLLWDILSYFAIHIAAFSNCSDMKYSAQKFPSCFWYCMFICVNVIIKNYVCGHIQFKDVVDQMCTCREEIKVWTAAIYPDAHVQDLNMAYCAESVGLTEGVTTRWGTEKSLIILQLILLKNLVECLQNTLVLMPRFFK